MIIQLINKYVENYNMDIKFIKFLFVGGINTLFGYSMFALFLFLGLHYTIAALCSTILGIMFNFKTTGVLVFKNHDNGLLLKFLGVYTITYLLNVSFLKIFNYFHFNLYIGALILVLPIAIVSFILMKKFVFGVQYEN
jgi:putative flippase GtrA